MAPRFGNALNTLSAAGGYMPQAQEQWLQVQARQRALADAQRQDAARQAYFQSLTTPDMAALPQQGQGSGFTMPAPAAGPSAGPSPMMPPMQQQQPMSPPSMQPPTAGGGGPSMQPGPGPQSMPQGQPPMMQPQRQGPAAPPLAAAPSPASQIPALTQNDPIAQLRQMAQSLARANPQLAGTPDGQLTLATALQQQIETLRGLSPDNRAALQAEVQVMKIQAASESALMRAQTQTDVANIRADTQRQINDIRDATSRRGQDMRADTAGQTRLAAQERLVYTQNRIDQRAAAASGNRQVNQQKAAQYKQIMAQRAQMKDAISGAGGIASPEQQKQLDALDQKAVQFWSANNWLPRPSELDRAGPDEAPGGANSPPAAAPAPAAVAPGAGGGGALPTDLPPTQGLDDGTVAKDGSGKVVAVVKGGQWAAPGQ